MALPIVGAHFRPPAKAILQVLPSGAPLWLRPEPDNPYDPNAIQVGVESKDIPKGQWETLDDLAQGFGFDIEAILAQEEWHLGYIPAVIAKTLKLAPGKHPGSLTFDPAGKPMVGTTKPNAELDKLKQDEDIESEWGDQ